MELKQGTDEVMKLNMRNFDDLEEYRKLRWRAKPQ